MLSPLQKRQAADLVFDEAPSASKVRGGEGIVALIHVVKH